jgi:predicted transcriptional regulator
VLSALQSPFFKPPFEFLIDEAEQLLRLASAVAFRQFASRFGGLMPMWHSRIRLTARVKIGGDD